jgi:hypothetical protein
VWPAKAAAQFIVTAQQKYRVDVLAMVTRFDDPQH